MQKPLPVGEFEWITEDDLKIWRNFPCVLEVDLSYPGELHDLHNDHALAPESLEIGKVRKLVPNLGDKRKYVVHQENLKLYLRLGMKLEKVQRGVKYREETRMRSYIQKNTDLRMKAKNAFEKDFFKLMNNSVYGKTMENIRKRVDVRLVGNKEKARKLFSLPNFKHCTVFDENLAAFHMA